MDKKNDFEKQTPHPPEPMAASFYDISLSQIFFSSDENLYKLVDHLGNGGDEIEFCQMQKLRLSDFKKWISQSAERQRIYQAALVARDEWMDAAILRQLRFLSQFDIRCIFTDRGTVKPPNEWGDEAGAVVSGFEVMETFDEDGELSGYVKKVKLWDKTKSIDRSVQLRNEMIERGRGEAEKDLLSEIKKMMIQRAAIGGARGVPAEKMGKPTDVVDVEYESVENSDGGEGGSDEC